MISTLKRLKGNLRSGNKWMKAPAMAPEKEPPPVRIPENFVCPISLELMRDPVIMSSGITYDRSNIDSWLQSGNYTCPATGLILLSFDLIPNHALRKMIQDWCVVSGVDRVPTPRAPLQPNDVVLLLSEFTSAAEIGNQEQCLSLLKRMREIGAESHRNCRCIVDHGAGGALVAAFVSFSAVEDVREGTGNDVVLFWTEALSALSRMLSSDSDACKLLDAAISSPCSASTRGRIAWFLEHGDENSKKKATLTLRGTILSCSHDQERQLLTSLTAVQGFADAVVNLIADPAMADSSVAKRAGLEVVLRLVSGEETGPDTVRGRELVQVMLDLLIGGANREVSEAALGVLDGIFRRGEGREEGYGVRALAVPVLVKKMLRVSGAATEMAVSALWRLCGGGGEAVMAEALEAGAFQKILVLLQIGCGEETKEKASELLKMLNAYRGRGFERLESLDFKHLESSFD